MANKKTLIVTANQISNRIKCQRNKENSLQKPINFNKNIKLGNSPIPNDKIQESVSKLVSNAIRHKYKSNIPIK